VFISQITPVKDRPVSLFKNIKNWLKAGIDQLVLIDYACPQDTYKLLLKSKYANDPRIVIVRVDAFKAGPFYSHAHARNIGAQVAKGEIFLFVDVDIRVASVYIKNLRKLFEQYDKESETYLVDMVCNLPMNTIEKGEWTANPYFKELPKNLSIDRQIAIRSAKFYDLNGFDEDCFGWGGETYDILYRANMVDSSISYVDPHPWVVHRQHSDSLRSKYVPTSIQSDSDKLTAFTTSMQILQKHRGACFRAHPGRRFGVTSHTDFKVFHRGVHRAFSPGDDL
jgi:hypothetical protein